MQATDQYLARYAEPEAALAVDLPLSGREYCLIIPAYDEQPDFFNRLDALLKNHAVPIPSCRMITFSTRAPGIAPRP